jgi:hypothetical protein
VPIQRLRRRHVAIAEKVVECAAVDFEQLPAAGCLRAEPIDGASPELWFGTSAKERFAEHVGAALAESGLAPARVRRAVVDRLRASCALPE